MHKSDSAGQDPEQVDGTLCADECLGATCIRPAGHEGNHRGDRRRGGGRITWWVVSCGDGGSGQGSQATTAIVDARK